MTAPAPATVGGRSRRSRPLLLAAVCAALLATAAAPSATAAAAPPAPGWGVYTAPGPAGVRGAAQYEAATGIHVSRVLDFLPDDSWNEITKADWLVNAYHDSGRELELSVPMVPRGGVSTLRACGLGAYDGHWRTVARRIRSAGLPGTIVRPGWEANGGWFGWTALDHKWDYISCFRHLVTAMRSQDADLRFSWSVNSGYNPVPGESIYPGDAWVDLVGIDVYDFSWTWYPAPAGLTLDQAQQRAASTVLDGERGLRFWAALAKAHGKPLALSEWGLSWRADGHGGGDDVHFVDTVLGFVADPANGVEYATYFNPPRNTDSNHNITAPGSEFPLAAAEIERLTAS